jgi:hypothetical protein
MGPMMCTCEDDEEVCQVRLVGVRVVVDGDVG